MRRMMLVSAAAVFALAACSKPAEKAAPAAGASTAGAAPAAAPLGGGNGPKPGFWKQTIKAHGQTMTTRVCMTEKEVGKGGDWTQTTGPKSDKCSRHDVKRNLDGSVEFDTVCEMGPGGTMTLHGKASGDFGTHYTVALDTTISGAMVKGMEGKTTTTIDAVREGECPAGWKPEDAQVSIDGMPNIGKHNAEELRKLAERYKH